MRRGAIAPMSVRPSLFPHVRSSRDLDLNEFDTYYLSPAFKMREIIREQLHRMDPEYHEKMPDIKVKSKL